MHVITRLRRYRFGIITMLILQLSLLLPLALLPLALGNTTRCSRPPPGINKLRRGVDITTLDLLPLDLLTKGSNGFRKPVVDFTCNKKHKWTDRRENTYDLPDQIWDILNVGGGWSSANVKIFTDAKDIRRSMSAGVSFGLGLPLGAFSTSVTYREMQQTITQKSRYIEEVSSYDSALRADLAPAYVLSKNGHFQKILNELPEEEFTTNSDAYFSFIKYFGTHYFTSGNFGGAIRMNINTKSSYYNGKSSSEIEVEAKASFLTIVPIHLGASGSTSRYEENENFTKSSIKSLRYFGGDANLLKGNESLAPWQPTVITNPWLFSGELAPITDLIDNPKKKRYLERATKAYLNKAFLRELERILKSAYSFPEDHSQIVESLTTRINTQLRMTEPDQTEVDDLGEAIQGDYSVPGWFSNDLKLCYNWYGRGHQCGAGGQAKILCAKPGHMTSYYRDDTDKRPGGCRMRWGLMPTMETQPYWFRSVQICIKWSADNHFHQCQSAKGTFCAPFGKYTKWYLDDTDKRPGGCKMSWQLKVPEKSPKWLKNAKLCFEWYPDNDAGQCGGGVNRTLCAVANHWTPTYRDDTDYRHGGCRMQWGIKLQ